jgi:hypothetical protein
MQDNMPDLGSVIWFKSIDIVQNELGECKFFLSRRSAKRWLFLYLARQRVDLIFLGMKYSVVFELLPYAQLQFISGQ